MSRPNIFDGNADIRRFYENGQDALALPAMDAHMIAGRRAAMRMLQDVALARGWNLKEKATGDDYDGQGCLTISGNNVNVDIGPAIDAAVCETVLRMQPEPKRRPWWRLW